MASKKYNCEQKLEHADEISSATPSTPNSSAMRLASAGMHSSGEQLPASTIPISATDKLARAKAILPARAPVSPLLISAASMAARGSLFFVWAM
jgi:hypothetical protein